MAAALVWLVAALIGVVLLVGHSALRAEAGKRERATAALEKQLARTQADLEAVRGANAALARRFKALRKNVQGNVKRRRKAGARALAASRKAPEHPPVRFLWPLAGPVTSPFGDGRGHEGIDIGAPPGTAVRSALAGTVVEAGWDDAYGNYVVVDHGADLRTMYAHLGSVAAGVGAAVSRGEPIGTVGCTGRCSGPHLHFEVRIGGVPRDPLRSLPGSS